MTTTINTVEELEALDNGTQVRVTSNLLGVIDWTKEGEMFTRIIEGEQIRVPASLLTGYLSTGAVSITNTNGPAVGDWYESGNGLFHVIKVDGDQVTFTNWYRQTFRSIEVRAAAWFETISRITSELAIATDANIVLLEQRILAERESVAERPVSSGVNVEELRRRLQALVETDDEDLLNEVLDAFGWGVQQTEEVTVNVEVSGHTMLDREHLSGAIGGARVDIEDEARVEWTFSFSQSFEVDSGDCACGNVNRALILARPEMPETFTDIDWNCDCDNC